MLAVPRKDFLYNAECGCTVVFSARLDYRLPSLSACYPHKNNIKARDSVLADAKTALRGGDPKLSKSKKTTGK